MLAIALIPNKYAIRKPYPSDGGIWIWASRGAIALEDVTSQRSAVSGQRSAVSGQRSAVSSQNSKLKTQNSKLKTQNFYSSHHFLTPNEAHPLPHHC